MIEPSLRRQPWWKFLWLVEGARLMRGDLHRRFVPYLLLVGIWTVASLRLFANVVTDLPLRVNWTASLPYTLVWVEHTSKPLTRGDYVVYRFVGEGSNGDQHALKDQPLFKQIAGLPGDVVTVVDRQVFLNGQPMGRAKVRTYDHKPLSPIEQGVIPAGFVYVRGSSPDSFDSRYSAAGLVPLTAILSRVRPLI